MRATVLIPALAACSPGAADTGDGPGTSDAQQGCRSCAIRDAHSYSIELRLKVQRAPLAAGRDATLRWSELGHDIFGRPLDPRTDLVSATLFRFHDLDPGALLADLSENRLRQETVGAFWSCDPQGGACALSSFSILGHALIPSTDFVDELGPYLLVLSSGRDGGIRSMIFLDPGPIGGPSTARVLDGSAHAQILPDLSPPDALFLASGPEVELDWSALSLDAWGDPLQASRLDRLRLDRLALDPVEIGTHLAELESLSQESWEAPIAGRSALRLGELQGETPLLGVDAESTWLATAWCDTCLFDLPVFAVLLRPASAPQLRHPARVQ